MRRFLCRALLFSRGGAPYRKTSPPPRSGAAFFAPLSLTFFFRPPFPRSARIPAPFFPVFPFCPYPAPFFSVFPFARAPRLSFPYAPFLHAPAPCPFPYSSPGRRFRRGAKSLCFFFGRSFFQRVFIQAAFGNAAVARGGFERVLFAHPFGEIMRDVFFFRKGV